MEVDFGGFSIREYARKMRSVDVEKCWPFSGEITGDRARSLLPPITVARFRWWSHDLAVLRRAAAEESDRPRRRAKAKTRPPKKRSIVEIFAAAPQIEQARCDSDGDSCNIRLINLKMKRKKKNPSDAKIASKVRKYKEHTRVSFCEKKDGARCDLGSREGTSDVVSLSRKKADLRCLSFAEEGKILCSTKSIVKDQDPVFQIHGILKTQRNIYTAKNRDKLNLPVVQREKHVRFSDPSHMLSERKKIIDSVEPSFCSTEVNASSLSSSEDLNYGNEGELPLKSTDQHNDSAHADAKQQNKFQHVVSERHSTHAHQKVGLSSFLRPHLSLQERIKHALDKPLHPSELGIISDNSVVADICFPDTTSVSNLGWKLTDHLADHVQDFATADLERKAQVSPHLQSFTSTSNEIGNSEHMHWETLQYWPASHRFPVERTQKAVVYRERQEEDAFLGFPLNLQGELVPAHGICSGGFDRIPHSGLGTGSSRTLSAEDKLSYRCMDFSNEKNDVTGTAIAKDGLDLFPVWNEKRPKYFPARLGVDETFTERGDVILDNNYREFSQSVHSPGSYLHMNSCLVNLSTQNDLIHNQDGKRMVESRVNREDMLLYNTPATMRLMGKDVTVGTSSSGMQFSWAGKVRRNEGIVAQNTPVIFSPMPLASCFAAHAQQRRLWPTTPGNSENTPTKALDNKWNGPRERDTLKDPVPRCCGSHLSWDAQGSTTLIPDRGFCPTVPKACCPNATSPIFDHLSFQGSGLSQPNSFTVNPQCFPWNSQTTATPLGYRNLDIDLTPVVPHAGKPSFEFPFLCTDATGQLEPCWPQNSLNSLNPWLTQRVEQAKTTVALQLSSQFSDKFLTSAIEPDYLMDGSAHQISLVNYPHDPISPCLNAEMSFVNPTQQLLAFSEFKSSSHTRVGKANKIKAKGRMDSKALGALGAENIGQTNKRQADVQGFPKTNHKIPKLQMQGAGGLESMKELATQNMHSEMWGNRGVHYAQSEHLVGVASPGLESNVNRIQTGPFKLSAGTKYVLKPNENMIQIPVPDVTAFQGTG